MPEAVRWLRSAAARWLGADEQGDQPSDWAAVGEAARRHNLEPLLFELTERGLVSAPSEARESWEAQYYRNQIFNLSVFETLEQLLADVRPAGIEPVVLKGPVAIARRFRDPGLRVMVDVDLLCRQSDLKALVEAALARGFVSVGENSTYHVALQHPELGAGLELHFDLYEVLGERAGFVEEVFRSSERVELDGLSLRAPSRPADLVLQLAHILQHDQRLDLRHWLDFTQAAMELSEAAESSELDRLVRETDLGPELAENLAIASRLFDVELGVDVSEVASEVWEAVEESLLELEDRRQPLAGARVHARWLARAAYVARLLVPSPGRWRALAVSEGTGVSTALLRHVGRAVGRGRGKVARRDRTVRVGDSARARLFRRRERS